MSSVVEVKHEKYSVAYTMMKGIVVREAEAAANSHDFVTVDRIMKELQLKVFVILSTIP